MFGRTTKSIYRLELQCFFYSKYVFRSLYQECERDVEHILHLNRLTDKLLNSFKNEVNVKKSHAHVANAHARLEIRVLQTYTHEKRS